MIRTRPRMLGAAALAAALLFTAACSDDDGDTDASDTSTTAAGSDATEAASDPYGSTEADSTDSTEATSGSDAAGGPTVAVADSDLGSILVDGQGVTLYLFTNDTQDEPSTCTGGCAAAWPAVSGEVTAGEGVDASLISTVENDDGSIQATYNGWPLYYYAEDTGPGDTNGQGSGGVWFVVDPAGDAIES